MRTKPPICLAAAAVLSALLAGSVRAGDGEKEGSAKAAPKLPNPAAVLQTAVKNLAKAKSYRATLDVVGGFSEKGDHIVTQAVVKESYEGDVYGSLMQCKDVKAFRTPTKGAAYFDGQWRAILSNREGVMLERLFKFPEVLLGRALKHAPKSAQWVLGGADGKDDPAIADVEKKLDTLFKTEAGDDGSTASPDEKSAKDGDKKAASDKDRGKTVVVNKPKGTEAVKVAAVTPRFMRIEAPPEEALTHIIEVQNSNCFGGG